jgi:hypothetical protein
VTYGAESWTLTNKLEKALMTWGRKILRKIYKLTHIKCSWRIKVNQEIYDKCKSPDIATIIKVYRLEQLGHVVRIDGKRTAKKLLKGKPERRREGEGGGKREGDSD